MLVCGLNIILEAITLLCVTVTKYIYDVCVRIAMSLHVLHYNPTLQVTYGIMLLYRVISKAL